MSKSEKDSKKNSVQTFIASFVNCIAAIGIVLANKGALRQWKFAISLTSIHFAFTFIGLSILCILGVFQFKSLPIRRVVPLCVAFCLNVVLSNISLQLNSVGFYQTMKIAITPFVCILEMIWIGKRFSLGIYISLAVIVIGVAFCNVRDFSTNLSGFLVGSGGVIATGVYQVLSKQMQSTLNCNEYQLLFYQAPISCLMLLCFVPFIENYSFNKDDAKSIWNQQYSAQLIFGILLTAFLAFFVNMSQFIVIKRTSALTYNVMSHIKTVLIILLGTFLFAEQLSLRRGFGMALAICGILLYSYFNLRKSNKDAIKKNNGKKKSKSPGNKDIKPKKNEKSDKKRKNKKKNQ